MYLATLGCAKNVVDSSDVRRAMTAAGWQETDRPSLADLVILNTCGFIKSAKEESIDTILQLAKLKKPGARLVMAGCFVQRNAAELAKALPEVDAFFGISFADELAENPEFCGVFPLSTPEAGTAYAPCLGASLDAGPGAAWLKISDGCDNRCSYCAIPLIRGPWRPRPAAAILREAAELAKAGVSEINLISQDSSRYRDPEAAEMDLVRLLDALEEIDGPRWIRVLYLHPATTQARLVSRLLAGGKVVPYFDLPVQALVDSTLERMKRRTSWDDIRRLVDTIRSKNSLATIRTTLITGYPGETATDHALTLKRMEEISFDKLGAFIWSAEEGTAAANEGPRVRPKSAEKRLDEIMRLQQSISARRLRRFRGLTLPVLIGNEPPPAEVEISAGVRICSGRSQGDAPDVDGLVLARIPAGKRVPSPGSFADIRIDSSSEYDLYGELA